MIMEGTVDARPTAPADDSVATGPWREIAEGRVGQMVGDRLRLERVSGVGGTAAVYAARHRNGRALAVKILHPEFAHNGGIRQRFLAEGYAANKVEHSDAVAILDEGEDAAGNVFLVMELLRGQTLLEQLIAEGPLPLARVVSAALRVLDVLAQGHERGVVHRDVKPSNIFHTDEGAIKLLDFGIARVEGDQGRFMTRPGTTLGTPGFMAPELAAGRLDEMDALTDLWAVGATMFQLLTGEDVHPSQNDNQLLVLAATQPARSLATLRPELGKSVVKIVDRALAFERRERWPSARAMGAALAEAARVAGLFGKPVVTGRGAYEAETAPEMAVPASQPAPSTTRFRAPVKWALGGALLLALGGTVIALRHPERRDWQVESGAASVLPPGPTQLGSTAAQPLQEASATPLVSVAPALSASSAPLGDAPPRVVVAKKAAHPGALQARTHAPSAPKDPSPRTSNPLFFPGQ
jgi:hypothetical protein